MKDLLLPIGLILLPFFFKWARWSTWFLAPYRFLKYVFSDVNKEREPPAWTRS